MNNVKNPFKSLNNSETENLDESAINPVIENAYYTTNTFNNGGLIHCIFKKITFMKFINFMPLLYILPC